MLRADPMLTDISGDSDEPGGPSFSWADISGTGTTITTWTNGTGDDGSMVVTMPTPFNYYRQIIHS